MAMINFDQELAWSFCTLAWEYAQASQLNLVDGQGLSPSIGIGRPITDRDRLQLWDLVHADLFFRLVLDKPPILTANMENWKVNLPTWQESNDSTLAMLFLISTRVSFILAEYFHLIDEAGPDTTSHMHYLSEVEALCIQIECLYDEWDIVSTCTIPELAL